MKLFRIDLDRWEEIFVTITRNKTRSLLTAFGVFWGIFMLVALLGGGQGLRDMLLSNFQGFATNSAFLWAENTTEPYRGFRKGRKWNFEIDDVERIKHAVPELDVVTPMVSLWGSEVFYKDKKAECSVKGLAPVFNEIENQEIRIGRFINDADLKNKRKVCTIGRQIYEELFGTGVDPIGQYIRVGSVYFQVVGVAYGSGNISINGKPEQSIIIPYTTAQQAYNFGKTIHMICMSAKDGYPMAGLQDRITATVRRAHNIHPKDKDAMTILNAGAMFGMIDALLKGINILIWMVGLGTLLAGAIGVSNIMMVTVRERTTEIGIRRAIGAKPRDILSQILSESMVLTTLAGLAGITLAVLVLQVLENAVTASGELQAAFQVSFWMAVGAALLLLLLGLLAGLAPAFRAMSIKPIDAIRDE